MQLHALLGFIISMTIWMGWVWIMNWGLTKVQIFRKWEFDLFKVFVKICDDLRYETSCFEVYHLYDNIERFGSWIRGPTNAENQICICFFYFFAFHLFLKICEGLSYQTKHLGVYLFNKKFEQLSLQIWAP